MKKITLFIFALALILSPRLIFAAGEGSYSGGTNKELKKAKIEARKSAQQIKKDAEKSRKQARKGSEKRRKEAEKTRKKALKEAARRNKELEKELDRHEK